MADVKLLEKKLVTMHAMTTFSEQGARAAHAQRKTEPVNTSLLRTSFVIWSAKLIGTLCSARIQATLFISKSRGPDKILRDISSLR